MKVRGELVTVETEELQKAVAQELLYGEGEQSPDELFKKGKKICDESHRERSSGDNSNDSEEISP